MRQIYEFFSRLVVVTDIQVIDDPKTKKSKGLAYVELENKSMIPSALSMHGQLLDGYPCTVQISQADKIRLLSGASSISASTRAPTRLHVSNLHEKITVDDLRPFFEVFGPCSVSLSINPATNKSDGVAFVSYQEAEDAKLAQRELNGMDVLDRPMKVVLADQTSHPGGARKSGATGGYESNLGELDDGSGGGVPLSAQSRVELMQKLQRNAAPLEKSHASSSSNVTIASASVKPKTRATTCIILKNMFDPKEETNPDFDLEIRDDVAAEADRFGRLLHIFVDRDSIGNVYMRYASEDEAQAALNSFSGRWFASRQIVAEFIPETTYNLRFPESVSQHR
jgi:RNA-binding protein 39